MRSEREMAEVIQRYGDMVRRLCMVHLKNYADTEDIFQTVFLKYALASVSFDSDEHEKAWLIRVAVNQCRDQQRFRMRHPQVSLDTLSACGASPESSGIIEALTRVPEPFRIVLTLYYVEECPMEEIARVIGRSVSAVKMRLQKGRKLLEKIYREEYL